MTTTAEVRALVVGALQAPGATGAGQNVFPVIDWPTSDSSYPIIYVQTGLEDKESLGRQGAPQFTVTTNFRICARIRAPAQPGGAGALAALNAVETFQQQIEVALINNPTLMGPIGPLQQIPYVRIEKKINADGNQNLGEIVLDLGVEYYQGPEDFYPIPTYPLEQITVDADLLSPYDPNGTYANPPFPQAVTPAPRTTGPDGRAEGSLVINLPQE
jgi:hypothetical protein